VSKKVLGTIGDGLSKKCITVSELVLYVSWSMAGVVLKGVVVLLALVIGLLCGLSLLIMCTSDSLLESNLTLSYWSSRPIGEIELSVRVIVVSTKSPVFFDSSFVLGLQDW
jgi:hypothetical protein